MNAPQSRINSRRLAKDQALEVLPHLIVACSLAVCALATAVLIGATLAAIPQLDAVLDQAERLRGM